MGILYTVALSSLGVYGILFAGWSSNSKYSLLGSLRSSAAMISYELILSSAIFIIIVLTGTLKFYYDNWKSTVYLIYYTITTYFYILFYIYFSWNF